MGLNSFLIIFWKLDWWPRLPCLTGLATSGGGGGRRLAVAGEDKLRPSIAWFSWTSKDRRSYWSSNVLFSSPKLLNLVVISCPLSMSDRNLLITSCMMSYGIGVYRKYILLKLVFELWSKKGIKETEKAYEIWYKPSYGKSCQEFKLHSWQKVDQLNSRRRSKFMLKLLRVIQFWSP